MVCKLALESSGSGLSKQKQCKQLNSSTKLGMDPCPINNWISPSALHSSTVAASFFSQPTSVPRSTNAPPGAKWLKRKPPALPKLRAENRIIGLDEHVTCTRQN